jgi:hypothetical protein
VPRRRALTPGPFPNAPLLPHDGQVRRRLGSARPGLAGGTCGPQPGLTMPASSKCMGSV